MQRRLLQVQMFLKHAYKGIYNFIIQLTIQLFVFPRGGDLEEPFKIFKLSNAIAIDNRVKFYAFLNYLICLRNLVILVQRKFSLEEVKATYLLVRGQWRIYLVLRLSAISTFVVRCIKFNQLCYQSLVGDYSGQQGTLPIVLGKLPIFPALDRPTFC